MCPTSYRTPLNVVCSSRNPWHNYSALKRVSLDIFVILMLNVSSVSLLAQLQVHSKTTGVIPSLNSGAAVVSTFVDVFAVTKPVTM